MAPNVSLHRLPPFAGFTLDIRHVGRDLPKHAEILVTRSQDKAGRRPGTTAEKAAKHAGKTTMIDTQGPTLARDYFLGELGAEIVGRRPHQAEIGPGEHLNIEREAENPDDKDAIRVENDWLQTAGYLPRSVASWLAPLIDSGKIRIEGYVPADLARPLPAVPERAPVTLMVFLTHSGRSIIELGGAPDKRNALHELALEAYHKAQTFADPAALLDYVASLEPLSREDLLPETRLVLALIPAMTRETRAAKTIQALSALHSALGQLLIGEPVCHDGLTFYPLRWPYDDEPRYLLLARAINFNLAVVAEVSDAGSVPKLRLINKSLRPLLIPEGEILVGAKQDRVVNVPALAPAKSTFTLPVSGVEQGRWRYRSWVFHSAYCAPPSLRAKKLRSVQQNRRQCGEAASDQHAVWKEVSRILEAADVRSGTESLTDGMAAAARRWQTIALPLNTAGIAVGRGSQIVGLELFDSSTTFHCQWRRLAQAYSFEAMRGRQAGVGAPSPALVREFLESVTNHARVQSPALGLGEEFEISGSGHVGVALLYDGRPCHLAVFREAFRQSCAE